MKKILMLYSLFTILLAYSCKDKSNFPVVPVEPEPIKYENLIPVGLGNYWIYQGYYLKHEDGAIDFPVDNRYGFVIHASPNDVAATNSSVLQMSICGTDLKPVDDTNYNPYGGSKLVYQNSIGFYYMGIVRKESVIHSFNNQIFSNAPYKGQQLDGPIFYYQPMGNSSLVRDLTTTKYVCISTDSAFTTPLGDFNCVVYKMVFSDYTPSSRSDVYYFIKPGIGIVGFIQKTYHPSDNSYWYFMKYVLTDYKLK